MMADLITTCWWLVRHGPVHNPKGLIYGQSDLPLDVLDPGPYRALAQVLPRDARYITSGRQRTHATLAEISKYAQPPLPSATQIVAFDEQSFGDWEGQSWDALQAGAQSLRFWQDPGGQRPPGGEAFTDVCARVAFALDQLSMQYSGQNLVLLAHGGTVRAALAHALGLPASAALRFCIDTCSITQLSHLALGDGTLHWQVDAVNLPPRAGEDLMGVSSVERLPFKPL